VVDNKNNCNINFQESFKHPEISTLKSIFNLYETKIERILTKNEKLKSVINAKLYLI